MAYDKPKVTIDLDEYNELIEKSKITVEDTVLMAKEIVLSFVETRGDINAAVNQINHKGIKISIPNLGTRTGSVEDISFIRTRP